MQNDKLIIDMLKQMNEALLGLKQDLNGVKQEVQGVRQEQKEMKIEMREGFDKVNESLGGIRQQFEESAKHRISVEEEHATDLKYLTRKVQEFDRFKTLHTPDN